MLIRSQNRTALVNLDCIQALNLDGPGFDGEILSETMIDAYMNDGAIIILGTYSTKERAMEVLDDLSQMYTFARLKWKEDAVFEIQDESPVVYWMPKEEEAEDDTADSDSTL